MFPEKITKEELIQLPLKRYEGEIEVITQPVRADECAREILLNSEIVGFDTETRPAFRKGQNFSVSLLQIATEQKVHLFRLQQTGLPPNLLQLLSDANVIKVGVALRDDIKELQQVNNFQPEGFLDLGTRMKELNVQQTGLRNLTAIFLGFRISKSQQTSNWEKAQLTEAQVRYAATDAWVCLKMHEFLQEKNVL
ncbi:MAG: 3'-5' exonuclease domain-containing protein 2 [Cytophagales bacterium]|nr:3'-5' exonuclease domain-containing protein 2 [Cytophagales bacterium]